MQICEEKILPNFFKKKFRINKKYGISFEEIIHTIYKLKEKFYKINLESIKNNNNISNEINIDFQNEFKKLVNQMDQLIGDSSLINEDKKRIIGKWIQQEIMPFMILTSNGYRWYQKPRGYAGDYLTIEKMYEDEPIGINFIGKILDRCFLNVPASVAVKNRRKILTNEILEIIKNKDNDTVYITSFACGPAREIFDVYEKLKDKSKLKVTLIDIDDHAINFVKKRAVSKGLGKYINFYNFNLVYLVKGRKEIDLPSQDLMYSIGLIDYFKDKFVIELINYSYSKLKSNGKLILGNFHPRNNTKAFMDYVLEWNLIHRNESDMNELFLKSEFRKNCTKIRYEDQKINLFAECVK